MSHRNAHRVDLYQRTVAVVRTSSPYVAAGVTSSAAFSEELGGVLNGATLIVFGAAVLGAEWSHITLAVVVYAVLSLTVVRMIPVAIAMLGSGARTPTARA